MLKKPEGTDRRKALGALLGGMLVAVDAIAQKTPALENDSYTEIDRTGWPPLTAEEENIRNITLSEDEARDLMAYKINHAILDNHEVMDNLKKHHDINPNFLEKEAAKVFMSRFYGNVIQEFKDKNPWDPKPDPMTAGNVMDHFWRRLSAHVQEDDIKVQCSLRQRRKIPLLSNFSYSLYLKALGEPETWRGNVPLDLEHFNIDDDKAVEDAARRRPQLDFPSIMQHLEISPDLLKIRRVDLEKALHMNVDAELAKLSRRTAWTDRKNPPAGQERS